jgi:hypothetical protein
VKPQVSLHDLRVNLTANQLRGCPS